MLILASTFILAVLFFGLWHRRNRKIHVPVMMLAFVLDLCLVLYIEFSRHAVEKAIGSVDDSLLMFHVAVSAGTLLLYLALGYTGSKVMRDKPQWLGLHNRLAYAFILCRLSNYVTSFWVPA